MSREPATAEKSNVTLLRLETGRQEYEMPEGSTLADLLRAAFVDPREQTILIDGKPIEEVFLLRPGMIVSASPRADGLAARPAGWRGVIGDFQDDPAFDAMMRTVGEEREAEREDL